MSRCSAWRRNRRWAPWTVHKAITESAKDLTKLVSNDDEDEDDASRGPPALPRTRCLAGPAEAAKRAKKAKKAKKKGVKLNRMFGSDESDASDKLKVARGGGDRRHVRYRHQRANH